MVTITQSTDETLEIILAKLGETLLRNRQFCSIFIRVLVIIIIYAKVCTFT